MDEMDCLECVNEWVMMMGCEWESVCVFVLESECVVFDVDNGMWYVKGVYGCESKKRRGGLMIVPP